MSALRRTQGGRTTCRDHSMKNSSTIVDALEELKSTFLRKAFHPIYLFWGEEDFLIDEALESLIDNAVEEATKSFNLDILYGSEVDVRSIVAYAASFPMMAERRVVIVREFDKLSNKDALLPYAEHPSSSTVLVLVAGRPDFRLTFFKAAKKLAAVVEFKRLYENNIPGWITERVEGLGKAITPEACQIMLSYVGRSLREIQNEIDKIFIFVDGKKVVEAIDVTAVVGMSKQYNIFELQKAIGHRNLSRSLEVLEGMLNVGENPVGIIVMLTKYFQKLCQIHELRNTEGSAQQIPALLQISPFFMKEYMDAAGEFSANQLDKCFVTILEADEELKSSAKEARLIMTLMLHQCLN